MTGWRQRYHRYSTTVYGPARDVSPLSWVGDERLAIGSMPTAATLYGLQAQGITHVVNCRSVTQTRFSQDLAMERAVFGRSNVVHVPLRDFGQPQPPRRWAAGARFAVHALTADPTAAVLIHCHQGRRRSAMVAYAVLRLRGHTPDQAAALITRHRLEAVLVATYVTSVEDWLAANADGIA
jgi:protein-tyrosine phosphatase